MKLSDFDFILPKDLIAQNPPIKRTSSRLLVSQSKIIDAQFHQIADFIKTDDLLVMNDTQVIAARLFARKKSGAKIEIMLERILNETCAIALLKANKPPKIGTILILENGEQATILAKNHQFWRLQFSTAIKPLLDEIGHIPLPPYIQRDDNTQDLSRYQTVYARQKGAVAAPTAGLHFDNDLLAEMKNKGINHAFITLHIGAGTFLPIRTQNIKQHKMHSEYFEIKQKTVEQINQTKARGGRIIGVGSTVVRSLESAAKDGILKAYRGETNLFIYPPFEFKIVDKMITNFHLPKSSLLMMVGAFIGRAQLLKIYQHGIDKKYRFFSYGDAMLLSKSNEKTR